jgi:uncharacterized protein with NRDE domain
VCTVVAIKGQHPEYPLVVGANRDEYYARASGPPRVLEEGPRIVAGVDLAKGGTWMGANEHGVFVAITNQRTHERGHAGTFSRGLMVMAALARPEVAAIDELLSKTDPDEYSAFNLMYGDARELRVAYARPGQPRIETVALDDGTWILTNDRLGSPEFPKAERALERVAPIVRAPWDELAPALAGVLGDHEKPPIEAIAEPPPGSLFPRELLHELQAICIHTAVYGTRSATILALEPGRVARYLYADGPPCTTAFVDVATLFGEDSPKLA